jgi:ABC-type Mn2+/Zn2+ transport system ATPase subunit
MKDGRHAAAPRVRLVDVACGYDRRPVLRDVRLDVPAQGVLALVGPNGSGKTTLLRVLLGLLPPLEGRVELPGGRAPRLGYVPQTDLSEVLIPVCALEVVLMGLVPARPLLGRLPAADRAAGRAALEVMGLAGLAERPFRDLSGGQRQRVLLARGLVDDPELLVLDEPVRGLDVGSSATLVATLVSLARERGLSIVVATHSLDLVANHADHVALVGGGSVRSGPAAEIMTDAVLTEFHGRPMHVAVVQGQRVVVTGGLP